MWREFSSSDIVTTRVRRPVPRCLRSPAQKSFRQFLVRFDTEANQIAGVKGWEKPGPPLSGSHNRVPAAESERPPIPRGARWEPELKLETKTGRRLSFAATCSLGRKNDENRG